MKVVGLNSHSVIQRSSDNTCEIIIGLDKKSINKNNTIASLDIKAYHTKTKLSYQPFLSQDLSPYTNHDYIVDSQDYEFYKLTGIPVGGPYDVTISNLNTSIIIEDILVGDVYLLGGQSNMQGIGRIEGKHESHPLVRAFYMDDRWAVASDPIHNLQDSIDPVHLDIYGGVFEPENPNVGVGPGVAIGNFLHSELSLPIGLIPCAHGGTSMDQWSPKLKDKKGHSLYGAMLRRFQYNGSNARGIFWYQGCNDAFGELADCYYKKMEDFIYALRKDTYLVNLPLVGVQLASVCYPDSNGSGWNKVQQEQYNLGQNLTGVHFIPAIDLEMDDFIHVSGFAHKTLGYRMAKAMLNLTEIKTKHLPPIALKTVKVLEEADSWNTKIILTYDHVIGELQALGKPSGFSLSQKDNLSDMHSIYKIEFDANQVILHTVDVGLDTKNRYLHYGLGCQPYCNITDSEDKALPVLTNIELGPQRNLGLPCTKAIISQPIYGDSIDSLLEQDMDTDNTELRDFGYFFLNVYNKFSDFKGSAYGKLTYTIPFDVTEDILSNLLVGGDGYLRLFVDDQLLLDEDLSMLKTSPENKCLPLDLAKGKHEIRVHYIRSAQKGSGIFIRFEDRNTQASIHETTTKTQVQLPTWTL